MLGVQHQTEHVYGKSRELGNTGHTHTDRKQIGTHKRGWTLMLANGRYTVI